MGTNSNQNSYFSISTSMIGYIPSSSITIFTTKNTNYLWLMQRGIKANYCFINGYTTMSKTLSLYLSLSWFIFNIQLIYLSLQVSTQCNVRYCAMVVMEMVGEIERINVCGKGSSSFRMKKYRISNFIFFDWVMRDFAQLVLSRIKTWLTLWMKEMLF